MLFLPSSLKDLFLLLTYLGRCSGVSGAQKLRSTFAENAELSEVSLSRKDTAIYNYSLVI